MKAYLINPFLHAAGHVLEAETGSRPTRGDLWMDDSHFTGSDVTVIISVIGQADGSIMFGFPERTAKRIASAMLGQPVVIFNRLAESAIAELGNMIAGRASGVLGQSGYACMIGPPTMVIGRAMISTHALRRLCVTLHSPLGDIQMGFALRENVAVPAGVRIAGQAAGRL